MLICNLTQTYKLFKETGTTSGYNLASVLLFVYFSHVSLSGKFQKNGRHLGTERYVRGLHNVHNLAIYSNSANNIAWCRCVVIELEQNKVAADAVGDVILKALKTL